MHRRYQRPPFEEALSAWKQLLKERRFSTDVLWILEENLCFEKDFSAPAGVKLGIQTRFTPHPPDAAKTTYIICRNGCATRILSPRPE